MDFKEQIQELKEVIINDIIDFCSIDSAYDEATVSEDAPFGAGAKAALDKMLKKGIDEGYEVHNTDNYAGDIEIGTGEEGLSILGHLDVVPATNDGWVCDPFKPEIIDGKLYGRGTSDDKGPLLIGYHMAKLYMKNHPDCNKKIRIIFGTNEERGSSCVKHYFTKMPATKIAFTPDAEFPVIYGEKAMAGFTMHGNFKSDFILSIHGGTVSNVVPLKSTVVLKGFREEYISALKEFISRNNDCQAETAMNDGNLAITFIGKAAHASTPEFGINANIPLVKFLNTLTDIRELKYIEEHLCDYNAKDLGVFIEGELGKITMNFGVFDYDGDKVSFTLDFRIPENADLEAFCKKVSDDAAEYGLSSDSHTTKALIIDRNSKLIKCLDQAYRDIDPNAEVPQAIGGGTYAKEANNCAGFGPTFPGENSRIHDANEFFDLESMEKVMYIYYRAIELIMED